MIHATEKSIEEHGDGLIHTIEAIELAIAALKDELENENADKIKSGIQNVTEASMRLGEAIYKASQEGDDQGPWIWAKKTAGMMTSLMRTLRT